MAVKCKGVLFALALTAIACGSGGSKSIYEQEARERAVLAAQALIATDHGNIMKMEEMVLDAKAVQSEYILMGDTIASRVFDEAFREYVTANDAELAKEIFN